MIRERFHSDIAPSERSFLIDVVGAMCAENNMLRKPCSQEVIKLIEEMRQAREADAQQLHTTTWLLKRLRQMKSALEECEAYFEERADAEYFTDCAGPCGNDEMRLLVEVQQALSGLSKEIAA